MERIESSKSNTEVTEEGATEQEIRGDFVDTLTM